MPQFLRFIPRLLLVQCCCCSPALPARAGVPLHSCAPLSRRWQMILRRKRPLSHGFCRRSETYATNLSATTWA
jgi:hypothetical protein